MSDTTQSTENDASPLMTEAEWRQQVARKECATYGHDWRVIETMGGPVALVCDRPCGQPQYRVIPPEVTDRHQEVDVAEARATAAEAVVARVATREFAERYLAEWVKPYFGDDATDAAACVQRAMTAALAPTATEREEVDD